MSNPEYLHCIPLGRNMLAVSRFYVAINSKVRREKGDFDYSINHTLSRWGGLCVSVAYITEIFCMARYTYSYAAERITPQLNKGFKV